MYKNITKEISPIRNVKSRVYSWLEQTIQTTKLGGMLNRLMGTPSDVQKSPYEFRVACVVQ